MKFKQAFLLAGLGLMGQTSFGQMNKNAVSKDSSAIVSWANGISLQRGWVNIADTAVKYSGTNKASYGYPSVALGKAGTTSKDVVSLGDGGGATVTFDRPIANGFGADFVVFENAMKSGNDSVFAELGFVEVSSDGKHFVRFPAVSKTQTAKQIGSFAPSFPNNVTNMAGNELQGFGTPFDLNDIADSANIDLQNIRFVRVIDAVGDIDPKFASRDSKGTIVNDPWPTPFASSGFDLDAIGAIHTGQVYAVSTFENATLKKDSHFSPTKTDTVIADGIALFKTALTQYGIDAFTYSNERNDSTPGFANQYSAITKGGISAPDSGGTNFAVAYINSYGTLPSISFSDKVSHTVSGFYITNTTYTYLSMKDGDTFAKKFGGTTGTDADWCKIRIWGIKDNGKSTDTVDFYLADFRSQDNAKDYIVNDWRWVDLSSLGAVKSVQFSMASSDVGAWGMNTPSYFCLDNLTVLPSDAPVSLKINDITVAKNEAPRALSLTNAFTAYDAASLSFTVESNSNVSLVQTSIMGKTLSLTFAQGQVGTAIIKVTATCNGKTVSNSFKVTVVDQLSGFDAMSNELNVYPNPCSSIINVDCASGSSITLYDLMGRSVTNTIAENATAQLSTESLSAGYYMLQVTTDTNVKTIKVIKK